MRKLYSLFFVLLFAISCREKVKIPPDIFPQSKMQSVLWDLICAGEFINGYVLGKDSIDKARETSKIYAQVFQVHQITKEEFDKSFSYYSQHPALMKTILDSLGNKKLAPTYPVQQARDSLQKKIMDTLQSKIKDTLQKATADSLQKGIKDTSQVKKKKRLQKKKLRKAKPQL